MEDIINGKTKDYPNPVRLELLMRFMDIPEEVRKKSGHNIALANIMNIITGIPVTTCESYPSKRDLFNKDYHREILKTIDEYLVKLKSSILFFPPKVRLIMKYSYTLQLPFSAQNFTQTKL